MNELKTEPCPQCRTRIMYEFNRCHWCGFVRPSMADEVAKAIRDRQQRPGAVLFSSGGSLKLRGTDGQVTTLSTSDDKRSRVHALARKVESVTRALACFLPLACFLDGVAAERAASSGHLHVGQLWSLVAFATWAAWLRWGR